MIIEAGIISCWVYFGTRLYSKISGNGTQERDNKKSTPAQANLQKKLLHLPVRKLSSEPSVIKQEEKIANRHFDLAVLSTVIAGAGVLVFPPLLIVSTGLLVYTTIPLFKKAIDATFRERRLRIEMLDSVSVLFGFVAGYYFIVTASTVAYFGAEKLRIKTENKSRDSLIGVFGEQPDFVWLLKDEIEVSLPFESLKAGDVIVVNAGESVPADGIIVDGIASIDQHMLTGEAQPAEKGVGEHVFAATLIISGRLHIRVEKAGRETTAAKIGEILKNTSDFTAFIESMGGEMADKSVLPTLAISATAFPLVGFGGSVALLFSNFMVNMRLTAPVGMLNFLHIASEEGILIKDGRSLQLLTEIDAVVFDKTGTLTLEQPHVRTIHTFNGATENEALTLAAAAEYRQTHPVASAILEEARYRELTVPHIDEANYKIGYGITVKIGSQVIKVGSNRFMEDEITGIPVNFDEIRKESYKKGCSLVCVAVDDQMIGIIELEPTIRPEAREVINKLRQRNISFYIISGDHEKPTERMAQGLGIDHYFAEVSPKDKAELIEELQKQGKKVCFVGDGINDSIALKTANVSVSMRGASTVATDSAQIVLMDQTLGKLPLLFDIAFGFKNNMKDIFIAINAPAVVGVGGVFLGYVGLPGMLLLYVVSVISGGTVAMLPYLKEQKCVLNNSWEK